MGSTTIVPISELRPGDRVTAVDGHPVGEPRLVLAGLRPVREGGPQGVQLYSVTHSQDRLYPGTHERASVLRPRPRGFANWGDALRKLMPHMGWESHGGNLYRDAKAPGPTNTAWVKANQSSARFHRFRVHMEHGFGPVVREWLINNGYLVQHDGRWFPVPHPHPDPNATPEPANASGPDWVDTFADEMSDALPVQLSVARATAGYVVLSSIRVDKGRRGEGIGTQVMNALIAKADAHGDTLAGTPNKIGADPVNLDRLHRWYRSFGFRPDHAGRHGEIFESMVRLPATTTSASAATHQESP